MLLHGIIADSHLSPFAADDILATSHRLRVLREAHDSHVATTDPRSAHFLSHVTAVRTFAFDGLLNTRILAS